MGMEVPPKEWYHSQGIPVGYGAAPRDELSPEEEAALEAEALNDEETAENMMENAMARGYERDIAPTDRTKEIQLVNFQQPFKYENIMNPHTGALEERLKEGDIPIELLSEFYGFVAPTNSLSNLGDRQIRTSEVNLRIASISQRMSQPRDEYTPQRNAMIDNLEQVFLGKINQARDGFERQQTTSQHQSHSYTAGKSRSRNLLDHIKG